MVEEIKDYLILANSIEQFKELENAYKNFEKNYTFESERGIKFLVEQNPVFEENIKICPKGEFDKIKEIRTNDSNLEGRIIQSGLGGWFIKLGEYNYSINAINPNFKKKN
ncbi:hypothetical protein KAJ87_03135 [Candidatus Pacearchaeota archaeon]|nr:hypothetical protein [Candidatus Pacearchaeota archaeon]